VVRRHNVSSVIDDGGSRYLMRFGNGVMSQPCDDGGPTP
jgi:hypothetical protein